MPIKKHPSHTILAIGLILLAVGFTMLDRGWLQTVIPKIGPVNHPLAALITLIGLGILLTGSAMLRHENNQDDS